MTSFTLRDGLPAEQQAIKTAKNPADNTAKNVDVFMKQIKRLDFNIDWSSFPEKKEISTSGCYA